MAVFGGFFLALALVFASFIADRGLSLIAVQRARIAADASALAAVHDVRAASVIARMNGGEMIAIDDRREVDGTVTVKVRVGRATRKARALDVWHDVTPTLEP